MSRPLDGKMKDFREKAENSYHIVIKGVMGCQVTLNAEVIENIFVTVVGKNGKTEIKLKVKYTCQYDEEIYHKLKNAFDSCDAKKLSRKLWRVKPIAFS
ncbi:MAG: hypothetical protein JW749_07015 [Sedimentisphaerales bacterium]|nr:hypothetical protein [Sedimentisphaerales bacterium]